MNGMVGSIYKDRNKIIIFFGKSSEYSDILYTRCF